MATYWQSRPLGPIGDPYLEWANETNFEYLLAGTSRTREEPAARLVPIIVELEEGITAQSFALGRWDRPADWTDYLRVPEIYQHPPKGLARTRYCTALVAPLFFRRWSEGGTLAKAIRRFELGAPSAAAYKPMPWKEEAIARGAPEMVVTAVIDDGLAFANHRFRLPDQSTRIEYFWNMDGPPTNPPSGFGYGWELRKRDAGGVRGIDSFMAAATHAGIVDEDEVYRATGHVDRNHIGHQPVALRRSHGTHVMDIAAGCDPARAPANRPLICVQLPVAMTADTSGATLANYVIDAMHYILHRADALSQAPLPVVVNLSYGTIAGPHDGSSVLEAALDDMIEARATDQGVPLRVVLPAGNQRQARCHARFELEQNASRELCWRIQPDDATPSFLELWLPQAPGASGYQLEIEVTTPTGDRSPAIHAGDEWVWMPGSAPLCKVLYLSPPPLGVARDRVFIAVAPTVALEAGPEVAPFGSWRVQVTNRARKVTLDAWIQRDDTPYGYPRRGRQSRFEDPLYQYVDDAGRKDLEDNPASAVKRDGSMSAIATGRKTVVIGGFRRNDWHPAAYSAGGQRVNSPERGAPSPHGPDALAVSDDSVVHAGLLATGTRSGSSGALIGTSFAAPQITRWIAEELAAGRPGDRHAVAQLAAASEAAKPPYAPAKPAPERGGAGRIARPGLDPHPR